jgi:TspO/MBR family protein
MGVVAWLVWREHGFRQARTALSLFLIQLAVNALWIWLFFVWRQGGWRLVRFSCFGSSSLHGCRFLARVSPRRSSADSLSSLGDFCVSSYLCSLATQFRAAGLTLRYSRRATACCHPRLTSTVRRCVIHSVTTLSEPSRVGLIPHRRKGGWVFVIFDTDGEVSVAGMSTMTNPVGSCVTSVP